MAGHSKWSNIKHRKGREDARRSRVFTKIGRQIAVAAREGGGDPAMNSRLRLAIDTARAANMPTDNIERAIKRGTGELEGANYEELTYEGYGPGGVAILLEAMTDNRNRTAGEIRHLFSRYDGNLGESGCVAWMFERRGVMTIDLASVEDTDELMLKALDTGADDIEIHDDFIEILTEPNAMATVREALTEAGYELTAAELRMVPSNVIEVEGDAAQKLLKLLDALEDHDDIQSVSANFDVQEDVLEALQA